MAIEKKIQQKAAAASIDNHLTSFEVVCQVIDKKKNTINYGTYNMFVVSSMLLLCDYGDGVKTDAKWQR